MECLISNNHQQSSRAIIRIMTDVMFSTDEITDRDIGTQMTTGTSAHTEYK